MPDASRYRFDYRPTSYWNTPDPTVGILSTIKGEERKRLVRELLHEGQMEELEDWMVENLTDEERQALGRIHPSFMGGEYLPDLEDYEVEIARVSLASTTADVISIRARRCAGVI